MFLSRLSRLGLRIAKDSGQCSTIKRGYFSRYFSHNLHPVDMFSCSTEIDVVVPNNPLAFLMRLKLAAREFAIIFFAGGIYMNNCSFSTTTIDNDHEEGSEQKETISVTFVNKDGEEKLIKVPIGMSMLEAAHQNDIDLEGACEGSLACSTCHVIVMDVDYYKKLEEPVDEENDMLDLAFGLTETSRLGCQVIAKPELDGMRLALPAATRNFAVDGYKPKPH